MKKVEELRIALMQSDIAWGKVDENLGHYDALLKQVPAGVHLVLLPETFSTGFMASPQTIIEKDEAIARTWMQQQALLHNFAVCGTIMVKEKGQLFNRFYFVRPDGTWHTYDKRHLFSLSIEKNLLSPGTKRVVVEYLGWRFFLQTCYDLRFPVWQRNVQHEESGYEYDVMLLSANWPASRIKAWNILLQGRAVENQCYVAATNRVGQDGMQTPHNGYSKAVDFKGDILQEADENREMVLCASLHKTPLEQFRKKFPFGNDQDRFTLL